MALDMPNSLDIFLPQSLTPHAGYDLVTDTVTGSLFENDTPGILTYTGNAPRVFLIQGSFSLQANVSNDVLSLQFLQNGSAVGFPQQANLLAVPGPVGSGIVQMNLMEIVTINPGDTISVQTSTVQPSTIQMLNGILTIICP